MLTERHHSALALMAALALTAGSVAACSQAEQSRTRADGAAAADSFKDASEETGQAVVHGAKVVGHAVGKAADSVGAEVEQQRTEDQAVAREQGRMEGRAEAERRQ